MTKQRLLVGAALIAALAIAIVIICTRWQKQDGQNNVSKEIEPITENFQATTSTPDLPQTQDVSSSTEEEIDTSDWLTYRNEKYGLELKYPDSWSPIANTEILFMDKTGLICSTIDFDSCIRNNTSLAHIVAGAGASSIDISTEIKLTNNQCALIHVNCPIFDLNDDEFSKLWTSIDESRKNYFMNGSSAPLTEYEVPAVAKKAYTVLKNIVNLSITF